MNARLRLLRWSLLALPWWERHRVGDEILSTLADAADAGRRQTVREAASLVALGLRRRLAREVAPAPARVVWPLTAGGALLLGATLLPGVWWAVDATPYGTFVAGPEQLSRALLFAAGAVAVVGGVTAGRGVRPHPRLVGLGAAMIVVAGYQVLRIVTALRFSVDASLVPGGLASAAAAAACCAAAVIVVRMRPRAVALGVAGLTAGVLVDVFLLGVQPAPRPGAGLALVAMALLTYGLLTPGRKLGGAYRASDQREIPT